MANEDETWIVPSVFDRLLGAPRVSTDNWQYREALAEIRRLLDRAEIPENDESMRRFVQTHYREWLDQVETAESAIIADRSFTSALGAIRRALEQMRANYREKKATPSIQDFQETVLKPVQEIAKRLQYEINNRPVSRGSPLKDLKHAVCRDVENLLNSRCRCLVIPTALTELNLSLVDYGIPDFTGAAMGQQEVTNKMHEIVREALEKYEPRFASVEVLPDDEGDSVERTLNLKIVAELHAFPDPEPVVFRSRLEPATSEFKVNYTP